MKITVRDNPKRRIDKFVRMLNKLGKKLWWLCYQDEDTDLPTLDYEVFDDINGVVWARINIDVPMFRIEVEDID